jgi:putative hydroxymethylpyrimidine transporter CytX
MLLLWIGASISISEVFTGGLLAPLGFKNGLITILIGHIIGTVLLALGAYISFSRKINAMDSVAFSFGALGGKIVAICNLVQLVGWIVILVVQAGSAINGVFPVLPFWSITLILSVFQILWAIIFGSPGGRINDIAVVLLAGICVLFFIEAAGYGSAAPVLHGTMSMVLGIELSIAMPVSWLPLVGDYASKADNKLCAVGMPFIGYFLGSCLMYSLGLFIAVTSGSDIFGFIASSKFRYAACAVILLSTITTNFVALYSAAVSSKQLIKTKEDRLPIAIIGAFTLIAAVFFPVERFIVFIEHFLTSIGMVFVPVFMMVFLDYFFKRQKCTKGINWPLIIIAFAGMAANKLFNQYEIGIPTVMGILLVSVLFITRNYITKTWYGSKNNP